MHWIFLSPHFDDAVLSCGGIIWEELHRGAQVSIWTVCAAPPPPGALSPFAEALHARWGTGAQATEQRRQEDMAACQGLGASYRHLDLCDCIYRRGANGEFLYASESSLTGALHPADQTWMERLSTELERLIPPRARLVSPLSIGNHVDHQLTRASAERLRRRLWYYADYPYVQSRPAQLAEMLSSSWQPAHFKVTEQGLAAWQASIAAHASQISTFWRDQPSMQQAIRAYWALENTTNLWKKRKSINF